MKFPTAPLFCHRALGKFESPPLKGVSAVADGGCLLRICTIATSELQRPLAVYNLRGKWRTRGIVGNLCPISIKFISATSKHYRQNGPLEIPHVLVTGHWGNLKVPL